MQLVKWSAEKKNNFFLNKEFCGKVWSKIRISLFQFTPHHRLNYQAEHRKEEKKNYFKEEVKSAIKHQWTE